MRPLYKTFYDDTYKMVMLKMLDLSYYYSIDILPLSPPPPPAPLLLSEYFMGLCSFEDEVVVVVKVLKEQWSPDL